MEQAGGKKTAAAGPGLAAGKTCGTLKIRVPQVFLLKRPSVPEGLSMEKLRYRTGKTVALYCLAEYPEREIEQLTNGPGINS